MDGRVLVECDVTALGGDRIATVVVAAGRGERAGQSQDGPKQYRKIGGQAVIAHTLTALRNAIPSGRIVVVIHRDDHALLDAALEPDLRATLIVVEGGATRQQSVMAGLVALETEEPDYVLIHDAARPFVEKALIGRVIAALGKDQGALPALPVSDTLKRRDAHGLVAETVSREGLHGAQTPQAFPYQAILAAHRAAASTGRSDFTDDCSIAEWAGLRVALVEGAPDNVKLTWARDIAMADEKLGGSNAFPDVRTGNGYDVHTFGPGDHVWLCGVRIEHDRSLSGHSDADVGLHALTDALLATIGAGDIGTHFPPSDPQWKGAASHLFVEHAAKLVRERKGRIANCDVTLIAEAPKVGPHREAMTAAMARMLAIAPERISIKATTNEKMGFVGRKEGIAAIATASVIFPGSVPE